MDSLIGYQKRKNEALFQSLLAHPRLAISSPQNYMPLYDRLFSFNSIGAANQVQLKTTWNLHQVKTSAGGGGGRGDDDDGSELVHQCVLQQQQQQGGDKFAQRKVFFKLAPLLDPFKYMTGKYGMDESQLLQLPAWRAAPSSLAQVKMADPNNTAYIDGFFVHLSSQLLHRFGFVHGIDHFASFLAIKPNYKVNVYDDIEDLAKNAFFNSQCGQWFHVEEFSHLITAPPLAAAVGMGVPAETGESAPKVHLKVSDEEVELVLDGEVEEEEEEADADADAPPELVPLLPDKSCEPELELVSTADVVAIARDTSSQCSAALSDCSSRTSYTSIDDNNSVQEWSGSEAEAGVAAASASMSSASASASASSPSSVSSRRSSRSSRTSRNSGNSGNSGSSFDDDDEKLMATLSAFPVHVIAMEHCGTTLDDLLYDYDLSEGEWLAMLMQIIMTLLVYKRAFWMTHNDLHSNNVMFVPTNKTHIHYLYGGKTYRVPTYGRLFKIIDFGRAIYSFCGKRFCSDSYAASGDAATQYNTEPYLDAKKPRVDPNFSFDLCRLACSLLDAVVDDPKHNRAESAVLRIVSEWCCDDRGLNMLYKSNGEERYPNFKLYKMIARHVHKHTPEAQLERPEFAKFASESAASAAAPSKKKKGKKGNARAPDPIVISIDTIPSFC